MIINYRNECWNIKTGGHQHHIEEKIRQIFEDLVSDHNSLHWTDKDIEHFLATEGSLFFESVTRIWSEENDYSDDVAIMIGHFKKLEKIILCVYGPDEMIIADIHKIIVKGVADSVSKDTDILVGWIVGKNSPQDGITINLIGICSDKKLTEKDEECNKEELSK